MWQSKFYKIRIEAFTVAELLIGMAISAVITLACLSALNYFFTYLRMTTVHREQSWNVMQLLLLLERDFHEADYCVWNDKETEFSLMQYDQDTVEVSYLFDKHYTVRKMRRSEEIFHLDTFELELERLSIERLLPQADQNPNPIRNIRGYIRDINDQSIPFELVKSYSNYDKLKLHKYEY